MESNVLSNTADTDIVPEQLMELSDRREIDRHQEELIELLNRDQDVRLQKAAIELLQFIETPCFNLAVTVTSLIKRKNLKNDIRIRAAGNLETLVKKTVACSAFDNAFTKHLVLYIIQELETLLESADPSDVQDALKKSMIPLYKIAVAI